jgi:hypothetical protein
MPPKNRSCQRISRGFGGGLALDLLGHSCEQRTDPFAPVEDAGAKTVGAAQFFRQHGFRDLDDAEVVRGAIGKAVGFVAPFKDEAARIAAHITP